MESETCGCPDTYICQGERECPRHSGFYVCCDRPQDHYYVIEDKDVEAVSDADPR